MTAEASLEADKPVSSKISFQTLAELAQHVGEEVGVSSWLAVTQEQVNLFAQATGDDQWIRSISNAQRLDLSVGPSPMACSFCR